MHGAGASETAATIGVETVRETGGDAKVTDLCRGCCCGVDEIDGLGAAADAAFDGVGADVTDFKAL